MIAEKAPLLVSHSPSLSSSLHCQPNLDDHYGRPFHPFTSYLLITSSGSSSSSSSFIISLSFQLFSNDGPISVIVISRQLIIVLNRFVPFKITFSTTRTKQNKTKQNAFTKKRKESMKQVPTVQFTPEQYPFGKVFHVIKGLSSSRHVPGL